ncbi:hypothetical protein K440DRAFT_19182 [Wilcoxina mikolae CBS 423.85]|nr:hypothetical protein K440DRAFT_19182 [Wilcoxina mikolae CBS 423.85]
MNLLTTFFLLLLLLLPSITHCKQHILSPSPPIIPPPSPFSTCPWNAILGTNWESIADNMAGKPFAEAGVPAPPVSTTSATSPGTSRATPPMPRSHNTSSPLRAWIAVD